MGLRDSELGAYREPSERVDRITCPEKLVVDQCLSDYTGGGAVCIGKDCVPGANYACCLRIA